MCSSSGSTGTQVGVTGKGTLLILGFLQGLGENKELGSCSDMAEQGSLSEQGRWTTWVPILPTYYHNSLINTIKQSSLAPSMAADAYPIGPTSNVTSSGKPACQSF